MAEGQSNTLKIVGITCGVLLLIGACGVGGCFLFCGGTFAGVWQATKAPADATKGFFKDIREDDLVGAHQRLSPEYRERLPLEEFRSRVEGTPALRDHTDDTVSQRNVSPGAANMGGHLSTSTGNVPFQVTLGERGETWKIESVTVGGSPL